MKVKCPSCATVGKLPAGKIPASGANIRCPSCSFVFFVGGPDGANLVTTTENSALIPNARETGSQVSVDEDSLRAHREAIAKRQAEARAAAETAASEAEGAAAEEVDDDATPPPQSAIASSTEGAMVDDDAAASDDDTATSDDAPASDDTTSDAAASDDAAADNDADATDATTEPASDATPPPPTTERAPAPRRHAQVTPGPSAAVATGSAPPVADPPEQETLDTPSGTFVVGPANEPWKARSNVGLVYDFPDRPSVRTWLGRRDDHTGIEVSFDGGEKWYLPTEVAGLRDVKPGSNATSTGRMRRSSRAVESVDSPRSSMSGPEKRKTIPPATTALSAIPDVRSTQPPTKRPAATTAAPVAAGSRTGSMRRATTTGSTRTAAEEARAAVEAKRAAADQKRSAKAEKKSKKKRSKREDDVLTRRVGLLAVLFIVGIGAAAYYFITQNSTDGFPDTPAGAQAQWALEMVNADVEEITEEAVAPRLDPAILDEHGAEVFVEQLRYFATTRTSYEFVRLMDSTTRTRIDAEIRTNAMEGGVLTVVVSEEEPNLIIGLQFQGDYAFSPTFR